MPGENDEAQLMWLEDDGEDEGQEQEVAVQAAQLAAASEAETEQSAAVAALEDELQRTRKELMDVRKELAAKTVQLSRKEVVVAQERVAELAAHVAIEKDKQLSSLAAHVEHLQAVLGQKEEELEESRRMYNAQKRALREALAAAAEAEAVERQADEARARTAVALAVEEELDRLQHELALLQARHHLEMRARDAELQSLRSELQAANANRKQAVAAAEVALTEAWQAEVARVADEAEARVAELEAEVARVRQQMEEHTRNVDKMSLAGELASLNQQKVAVQREFDAFRDMATAAARQNREMAARLMEENATLKSRLAARAFQDVQAGFKPQSKVFTALTPPHGGGGAGGGDGAASAAGLLGSGAMWMEQLPALLARLERQRKGLVPALVIGGVLALFLLVAVVRAAAVTRSEHSGGLCFLAHLGINVGPGCGPAVPGKDHHHHSVAEAAQEELEHLLDETPRVHDLETMVEGAAIGGGGGSGHKGAEAAAGSAGGGGGHKGAEAAAGSAGDSHRTIGVLGAEAESDAKEAVEGGDGDVEGHQEVTADVEGGEGGGGAATGGGQVTTDSNIAAVKALSGGAEAAVEGGVTGADSTAAAATEHAAEAGTDETVTAGEEGGVTAWWQKAQGMADGSHGQREGAGSATDGAVGTASTSADGSWKEEEEEDQVVWHAVAARRAARTTRRQSRRTLESRRAAH